MKPTLIALALSLAALAGCSKSHTPPPDCPTSNPDCSYTPTHGLFVAVHAGVRECAATLDGPDVVVAPAHCLRGAALADVSVEVEGETLSAVEVNGEADALRVRVAHAFSAAE